MLSNWRQVGGNTSQARRNQTVLFTRCRSGMTSLKRSSQNGIETDSQHIDALAAFFVTQPERFDVIVASNLFGDVLTDIGAAIMGSVGIAPAANINVNGKYPSMFEPVHGSAPDIVGKGIANPIGQIWTAKLMLDSFGEEELGYLLLQSIETVTNSGILTPDVGGKHSTEDVTSAIISQIKNR